MRDIPSDVIDEVRLGNTIVRSTTYASSSVGSDPELGTGFSLGQQVFHKAFGEGVILNFEGSGPRARVHIKFEEVGTKILILESAGLSGV